MHGRHTVNSTAGYDGEVTYFSGVPAMTNPLPSTSSQRLYRIHDVALLIGVSPRTVWALIASGKLRAARIGNRTRRIAVEDLDAFIADARRREGR
jgi:excisionase family DNA binding protein